MSKREDALDMVRIQVLNRTTREDIISIVTEAIADTRQMYAGDTYIRHGKTDIRLAYTLWMQQKYTDKTMNEIYIFIADRIDNMSVGSIRGYVRKFIKGYNPYEMAMH
jgi:hypothetical protein